MNLVNKILILLIAIFLINYLTKGKILDTVKKYILYCVDPINKLFNNNETPIELVNKPISLPDFIKNIKTQNSDLYQLTKNYKMKKKAPEQFIKYVETFLNKTLNNGPFKFTNIKLIDEIYYIDLKNGKEIIPFTFKTDVNNETLLFNIEVFFTKGQLIIININFMKEQPKETFEDLFIKLPDDIKIEDFEELNDSLIPSIINISSYEMTSENNTSNL